MSNFSQTLTQIVDKNALKKKQLAKKTRMGKKRLARILSGKKQINDKDFRRLAKAVTVDELDQAHMVVARMLDVCTGPGKELVTVHIKGERVKSPGAKGQQ